jgi:exodeoxyribonuclease-3
MKICCWNVNGIRAITKKEPFLEFITSHNADIVLFQETKINVEFEIEGLERYKHKYYSHATTKKGYSGVAVFSKIEPINVVEDIDKSGEGRTLQLEFDKFYLINVYVMNSGASLAKINRRVEWDKKFRAHIKHLMAKKPVIIAGDFNTIIDPKLDYHAGEKKLPKLAGLTPEERKGIHTLIDDGFVDAFRYLHPELVKFSYYNYRTRGRLGWRIDFTLVSESIKNKIISSDIRDDVLGSDHRPIVLNIDL